MKDKMKQLILYFVPAALIVIIGGLIRVNKVNAQQCPAPCGQTSGGYYLCTWQTFCNPREPNDCHDGWGPPCAWQDGCCSKCSETDCCGAAVGGGTGCGGGGDPAPTLAPPGEIDPNTGRSPNCNFSCGWQGCGCACTDGDWGPWGPCQNGWQTRYKNVCSQAEPAQDWQQCNSCTSTGPAAPGPASPADGSSFTYGNTVTVSWYDAPDQSRGDRVFVPDGGCNRYAERNVNCRQECRRTNRRGECTRYETVCDRQTVCVDPSGHWTRTWYGYDWGKWECVLSGSQDGRGSFAVYVNDHLLGTVGYAGDTLTAGRTAGFTIPVNQMTIGNNTWYVVADSDTGSAASPVWDFTLTAPPPAQVSVSGTVYSGTGGGLNKCAGPGTPFKPGGGSKVSVNPDGREGPVEGNGSYQVSQVAEAGAKTIALSGMDPDYVCSCPGSCQYTGAEVAGGNNTGWNFYVSNIVAKWAQVIGGHVHGQAGITVAVPAANYFMIPASFTNNPGAATKTSGNITTFPGSLSATNWNLTDVVSQSTWRYSYQRLWVRAGSPSTDPGDGSTSVPAPGIYRNTGDYTVNSSGWQNLTGSRVIFVDGDLAINYKVSLADEANDFLAFIVSGDINVNPDVGDAAVAGPTPSQADLVGAFLANGNWSGGTNTSGIDKQLVIYGTIGADIDLDGSGRVRFQRDMGADNSVGPGVSVIWNPNLLLNFPDQLSDALTDWREVAP